MSEEPKKVIGFRVTRTSKGSAEMIQADECRLESVPTHVFLLRGKEVDRVPSRDLAGEPVPVHPQSQELTQALNARRFQASVRRQRRTLQ